LFICDFSHLNRLPFVTWNKISPNTQAAFSLYIRAFWHTAEFYINVCLCINFFNSLISFSIFSSILKTSVFDFIFRLKTGALIEAAFLAGAYLAGCDDETADKLCRAASLIGFAFQIRDDILDVTSSLEELGKPVFSDEKNNKTTYVTLYGMEKAEADVESMSDEALDIIKSVGKNEFLEELVLNLIHRNK